MTSTAATASPPPRWIGRALPSRNAAAWLCLLVGLLGLLHLSMALGRSINWDEFWFYALVEQFARGDFTEPLQTIHTRLFAWWLPQLPGNEIDHILIARLAMLACLAVTATAIFLTAERLSDRQSALLALAAYLGAGFVLHHGTSFRADPIVTACLASALAIAARTRLNLPWLLGLGALIGLAAMVSIKMVLWLPAFAGIALYRWEETGFAWDYLLRWIAAGLVALLVFAGLYLAHSTGMEAEAAQQAAQGTLDRSADKVFGILTPTNIEAASKALLTGLPLAILVAIVPFVVLRERATWSRKVALVAVWFPALTPLFYFNAHPYFYAFILPPVAVAASVAVPVLMRRYGPVVLVAAIGGSALLIWAVDPRGVTERQHALVNAVHETFPQPVPYFDCCGMIGSSEKANTFRTAWGVERYLGSGRPLQLETMRERAVPLLIDNNKEFSGAMSGVKTATFHPDDVAAMRSTYIRLWGDIFVAGRDLEAGQSQQWHVLVPGEYRVEGTLRVDGANLIDGATVALPRGVVELANPGPGSARLIWGRETRAPSYPAPSEPYWTPF